MAQLFFMAYRNATPRTRVPCQARRVVLRTGGRRAGAPCDAGGSALSGAKSASAVRVESQVPSMLLQPTPTMFGSASGQPELRLMQRECVIRIARCSGRDLPALDMGACGRRGGCETAATPAMFMMHGTCVAQAWRQTVARSALAVAAGILAVGGTGDLAGLAGRTEQAGEVPYARALPRS
jgi:hypothetical protein